MKPFVMTKLVLLIAVSCSIRHADAQNWQTVDDFTYTGDGVSATWVMADRLGNLYVTGWGGGPSHGLIRSSRDGGSTWATVDDFGTGYGPMHADSQGNLFVVGWNESGPWVIRRSTDQGQTWVTIFDTGTGSTLLEDLAIDTSNRIYAIEDNSSPPRQWSVMTSADGGGTWQQALASPIPGYAYRMLCLGSEVYVNVNPWQVWKSSDLGATWSLLDTAGTGYGLAAVAADATGGLYVVGGLAEGYQHWIVRKGQGDGTGWQTVDDFVPDPSDSSSMAVAHGIAIDPSGNVFVSGFGGPSGSQTDWFVREFSAATHEWITVDDFSYGPGYSTHAFSIACDPSGNVFVVGTANLIGDPTVSRWLVRKLAASQPLRPALVYSRSGNSLTLSWPASAAGFTLETSDTLGPSAKWSPCALAPQNVGDQSTVTLDRTNSAQYFRLRR